MDFPTSQAFEEALLGPYKQRPFHATDGNNIRYSTLLLFVDRIKGKARGFDESARLSIYEDLVLRCENKLLLSLDKAGASYTQEEIETLLQQMREELVDFLCGEEKGEHDIALHIFCAMG